MWRMEIREMEGKDSCSEFRGDKSGHWARDSGRRTHRAWARKKMVLTKSFFCDKEKEGRRQTKQLLHA